MAQLSPQKTYLVDLGMKVLLWCTNIYIPFKRFKCTCFALLFNFGAIQNLENIRRKWNEHIAGVA